MTPQEQPDSQAGDEQSPAEALRQQISKTLQDGTMFYDGSENKIFFSTDSSVDAIMELVTASAATVEREARLEHLKALAALAGMYGQYCDGPFGHDFMGAGEDAIEILENYKLAKEDKGVDYEAVTKLEREIDRLAALQGPQDTTQ